MALPTGLQVDIEFTAGVWTNVSAYVSLRQGISLKFGRTDSYGAPQVATAQLRLDNFDGRFTPKSSGSPYYPNVVPRKRLRVSYASGSSSRFVGYIKQWLPTVDGDQHYVTVAATCRLDVLSRSLLATAMDHTTRALSPVAFYPLSDDNPSSWPTQLTEAVSGVPQTWGATWTLYPPELGAAAAMPNPDGRTGLIVDQSDDTSSTATTTAYTWGNLTSSAFTLAAWVRPIAHSYASASNGPECSVVAYKGSPLGDSGLIALTAVLNSGAAGTVGLSAIVNDRIASSYSRTGSVTAPANEQGIHLAATGTISAGTLTLNLYVNGALASTGTNAMTTFTTDFVTTNYVPSGTSVGGSGTFNDVAWWNRALSAGEVLSLYQAGTGFTGELSGARITRALGWAGLSAADYNIATGAAQVGPTKVAGTSVLDALQSAVDVEDGGAVAYVDVDGKVRFNDSTFRSVATAALTADAEADLDGDSWQPVYDDLQRVNDATVARDGGASARYVDSASVTAIGTVGDSSTIDAYLDEQLLPRAQWRVNSSSAYLRIPQVTVDLMTAQNSAALYTALASVTIGSMLRVSGLPATLTNPTAGGTAQVLPTTYIDGYVEGWSEQITADRYEVTFDLSPYIPRHILGNTTWGRLTETPGTMTLTSTITSGATSMSLTTAASNPTLTTSAGDFPLFLRIDEEVVSVSSAPAGSSSPQTLTITRAALGTIAAAHTAGATVSVVAGALTV